MENSSSTKKICTKLDPNNTNRIGYTFYTKIIILNIKTPFICLLINYIELGIIFILKLFIVNIKILLFVY